MNIQQANFEDLLAAYYVGTKARIAAKNLTRLIRRKARLPLAKLLRDFRSSPVWRPREIADRAAVDQLMTCYSAMEIASIAGMLPDLRDTAFGAESRRILEDRDVRAYYERFYPTRMPQLFRLRLEGNQIAHVRGAGDSVAAAVMAFLDLDRRFMENLEDETLLRMLDSFTIDGYTFDDVVALFGKPKKFLKHLMHAPEDRDARSWALHEFSMLMQFCFDLRALLSRLTEQPVLQSGIWNHYEYWFMKLELDYQLDRALSEFLDWEPPTDKHEAGEEIQAYVRDARGVLKDLTSSKYARPVKSLLKTALSG